MLGLCKLLASVNETLSKTPIIAFLSNDLLHKLLHNLLVVSSNLAHRITAVTRLLA